MNARLINSPQRIVCLSAEAADWFWRLGVWDSVVGVTAYFSPPPEAPPKPRVSGFSSANLTPILQLEPDLVVVFSDVQAGIAAQLISRGCNVIATNPRTLTEVETTLALLARIVDRQSEGETLLREFRECLVPVLSPARRPRLSPRRVARLRRRPCSNPPRTRTGCGRARSPAADAPETR